MLKLGNVNINKAYLGSTEIKKMYLGNDLVFDNSSPAYQAETVAYMNAIAIPNDSSTYYSTLTNSDVWNIVDAYVVAEKANGTFQFFDYPMIGGTAAKHAVNLVNPSTFNVTWYGGWTHNFLGALPNGVNAYGDTGFRPSEHQTIFSNGLTIVLGTNNVEAANSPTNMGSFNSFSQASIIIVKSPSLTSRMNSALLSGAITNYAGIHTSVRQSNAVTKLFYNRIEVFNGNSGGSALPTLKMFLGNMSFNTEGNPYGSGYSSNRIQGAKAHAGITDAQAKQHFDNINAREIALLRKTW